MAKIKLTKNEQKVQKDALKMYKRYLPTLTLKKQQLQTEIRTIDAKAKEVRAKRVALEKEFDEWISVFGEADAFKPDMVTVRNIKKVQETLPVLLFLFMKVQILVAVTMIFMKHLCGLIWLLTEWKKLYLWILKLKFLTNRSDFFLKNCVLQHSA